MHVDVLTLRFDPARGALDGTALREFVRDKVVLAVRDHFFQVGSVPHIALVIEYRLAAEVPAGAGRTREANRRRDSSARTDELRESLAPADRELFDRLRRWRAGLARDEGIPAYAVLTNAELTAIARLRPSSRSALVSVDGLGRKRAERYAKDLLAIISRTAADGDVSTSQDG